MRSHFIVATVFVLMTSGVQGPDPDRLGPQIGERVADFTLPDQQGVARPLRSMLGPQGAVLVFFRSADW
jgi:hypothetical protein